MADVFEKHLKQFLDTGLLKLVVCFVDRQHMQYHPEQIAVTGTQEAVDPLYNFFTQAFNVKGIPDNSVACVAPDS